MGTGEDITEDILPEMPSRVDIIFPRDEPIPARAEEIPPKPSFASLNFEVTSVNVASAIFPIICVLRFLLLLFDSLL